jgi:alanine racemase
VPFLQQAHASPNLQVLGLATHLATISDKQAVDQLQAFHVIHKRAEEIFQRPLVASVLSGGALLAHPEYPDGLPRVGLALYGVAPPRASLARPVPYPVEQLSYPDVPMALPRLPGDLRQPPPPASLKLAAKLKPVMRASSTVIQVKRLRKGETVSYERTFKAPEDMTLAVIPFGYVNGLSSSRSGKGCALIRGAKAPQVGRVCMNLSAYDVTLIPSCRPGDEVVLLGGSEEETLDAYQEFGEEAANPYETLCLYGGLNRRVHHWD